MLALVDVPSCIDPCVYRLSEDELPVGYTDVDTCFGMFCREEVGGMLVIFFDGTCGVEVAFGSSLWYLVPGVPRSVVSHQLPSRVIYKFSGGWIAV